MSKLFFQPYILNFTTRKCDKSLEFKSIHETVSYERNKKYLQITDDRTRGTSSSISSFQWVCIATFTQIVNILMDNQTTANYASWTNQWDQTVRKYCLGYSRWISFDISQISNVTNFIIRSTVVELNFEIKLITGYFVRYIRKVILPCRDYNERQD